MALKEELEKQGNWLFRYRSFLPIVILVIGLAVFVQTSLSKSELEICTPYVEIGCLVVSLIGLAIRIYTVGYTPRNTSGRNTAQGQLAETLNTTGIYSIVRHPLYLGNFFMWLGFALFTQNTWFVISFILFYWIYYERIMFAEEQFLERKFGETYRLWADKVPAFLPSIRLFNKPEITFSIKKVLKKEKNGLFAVFLIFTVFDFTDEYINEHTHYNKFFIAGFVITMLMYMVLKFLKSKTGILNDSR